MNTLTKKVEDVNGLVKEVQKLFSPKHYLELIQIAIFIVIAIIVIKIITVIIRKAGQRREVDPSLLKFFIRISWIAGIVIVIMHVLSMLNFSGAGLIAIFSAAAAALALALKDNLTDLAGGIIILFTKPFKTGDFIEFGDHKGYVEKIDLMHTSLRTYDDTNVIIPNRCLTTTEVNNYTKNPEVRVQLFVPISYEEDIERVKKVLYNVCYSIDNVIDNEKFSPKVRLERFGESSVDLAVRVWTNFSNYWQVYYGLTEGIKKEFENHDIVIPYNQLDVHIDKEAVVK
jgi:small conductance mechanosensitive channel